MSRLIIYGLVDPRTRLVRYVGKSTYGIARAREHGRPSSMHRWAHTYVSRWIKTLQSVGLSYEIVVLDCSDEAGLLADLERYWIAFGRAAGWTLTNLTDGGDGTPGHRKSAETRAKIGAKHRGKTVTDETRRKMSAVQQGKKRSAESIEKQRKTITGRKATTQHRAAISAALRGKPKSKAARQAISLFAKTRLRARGRWL